MDIGRIASASSHVDYVCQVYGPGEAELLPRPEDYGFGTFVGIEAEGNGCLVGVIHNTTLLNPEFGNLGPRLSPQADLAVFAPDYLSEKVTVVAIIILGMLDAQGLAHQGVPTIAARIDARVRALARDEIVAFHASGYDIGASTGLKVSYLPLLVAMQTPLTSLLLERLVSDLCALFPSEAPRLSVLRNNVAWRARIQTVG